MSQVQQTQQELKEIPLPHLQPVHVERIMQMVNEMPTLYGRPIMNFIESVALQQYQESQKASLVNDQEVVSE